MPPLTDPGRSRCYRNALRNWSYTGYVFPFKQSAWEWLRANLPQGYSQREIARLLHLYVEAGGEIDEQPETRELWKDLYPYHYDLRVEIVGRRITFETCLEYRNPDDPDDPVILVVNAHDA